MMGARGYFPAEEPVHEVEITQDFYLGIYPVTQAQFRAWTQAQGIKHKNKFEGKDQHPAENLNWFEARRYCDWLMQLESAHLIPEGFQARLPTESEWEFACSAWQETEAGQIYTEYHTGDGVVALQQAGWFGAYARDNRRNVLDKSTQAVGQLTCNRHGLHDMHGNVWEWCLDTFVAGRYSVSPGLCCDPFCADEKGSKADPCTLPLDVPANEDGTDRVQRGGSWGYRAADCRASYRYRYRPDHRSWNFGFRVGLFPVPCQQEQPDQ